MAATAEPRPTAAELTAMDAADFAAFVRASGIKTVSEIALSEYLNARVVHTYKGEGLTACGLEVVGPCPDCATANGERT